MHHHDPFSEGDKIVTQLSHDPAQRAPRIALPCFESPSETIGPMKLGRFSKLLFAGVLAIQAASTADWKQGKLLDISMSSTPLRNGKPAPQKMHTYS
jgi:hypothetical protein